MVTYNFTATIHKRNESYKIRSAVQSDDHIGIVLEMIRNVIRKEGSTDVNSFEITSRV